MKTYTLLVLKAQFVREVNAYLNELYNFCEQTNHVICTRGIEHFKLYMWNNLKSYWQFERESITSEFEAMIPHELKEPSCTLMKKESRGEFVLDNGETIPMFNYAGKLVSMGEIPQILGVFEQVNIHYNSKGETRSEMSNIANAMKDFHNN